ncbi:MAG TPA: alpha-amylase family glycosyl hydrolase, partial [Candidatus Saccharimonadia bacterium]|nr:alpha-amylase family glycosyl hydrolase [Candidatus Saccharimonadia bacterium]
MSKAQHPLSMRGRVVYQIYPRSFYDSNGDGIGDIPGITKKLDYLGDGTTDSLGVNMIWLSPFYPSPMADFGYDVSDYCNVDPIFGTLEDFKTLLEEAHRRSLKVMIDFVPNHTSDQHPWFAQSSASRDNARHDWYIWRDPGPDGGPPNNWLSVFGGSAWEFNSARGQYYMHSFLAAQPDLNWANPAVRKEMQQVIRFWLDLGVDGLRVDAVDWMAKDPQFRDNPPNPHYQPGVNDPYHEFSRDYSQDGPGLFFYLEEMAAVLKEYPDRFMVTETYPNRDDIITSYLRIYHHYQTDVSAPFNFEGLLLPWKATDFKTFVDHFQGSLDPEHLPIYVLGNHDKSRLASRLGEAAARTAAMMLLTLPGVAFVYYGDELGLADTPVPPHRVQDPFEKRVPGLGLGRDPQRSPMPWSSTRYAGFSRTDPWLPVNPDYRTRNVQAEQSDPRSMLVLYRKLIHLRNFSPMLQYGAYIPLDLDHP